MTYSEDIKRLEIRERQSWEKYRKLDEEVEAEKHPGLKKVLQEDRSKGLGYHTHILNKILKRHTKKFKGHQRKQEEMATQTKQKTKKPHVKIYVDGAVSFQHGPGGWGAVLIYQGRTRDLSGTIEATTSQRAEIVASIHALHSLKVPCNVEVFSDSAYLVNAMTDGWLTKWEYKDWINSKGEEVANRKDWETLRNLCQTHKVRFTKVKGHSGDKHNEAADALAKTASRKAQTRQRAERKAISLDEGPEDPRPSILDSLAENRWSPEERRNV